ncbi:unnamed protein product, partial [marine sediment metagenome]
MFVSAYGRAVLIWFDLLDVAMKLGKRVAVCGQSMGPLEEPCLRRAAKKVLPRLTQLILREQDSVHWIESTIGSLPNIRHLPDTAFFIPLDEPTDPTEVLHEEGIDVGERAIVTMSVRSLGAFLALSKVRLTQREFEGIMADAADHMIESFGCFIVFVGTCTEIFGYKFDDRVTAMRVRHRMRQGSG